MGKFKVGDKITFVNPNETQKNFVNENVGVITDVFPLGIYQAVFGNRYCLLNDGHIKAVNEFPEPESKPVRSVLEEALKDVKHVQADTQAHKDVSYYYGYRDALAMIYHRVILNSGNMTIEEKLVVNNYLKNANVSINDAIAVRDKKVADEKEKKNLHAAAMVKDIGELIISILGDEDLGELSDIISMIKKVT